MDEFGVIYKEVDSEGIIPRSPNTAQTVEEERRGFSFNMEEAFRHPCEGQAQNYLSELDSEENLSRFVITTIISIKFGEDCEKK